MSENLMARRRAALGERHYFVQGEPAKAYWHNFSKGPLDKLISRYGDEVNLVILGSPELEKDFYILPWSQVRYLYRDELLQTGKKKRWVGKVNDHELIYHKKGCQPAALDITEFYGLTDLARQM